MSGGLAIHLDTTVLRRGLEALALDRYGSTPKRVRAALELCGHLAWFDRITYDGNARLWTAQRLSTVIDAVQAGIPDPAIRRILIEKLCPVVHDETNETDTLRRAIQAALHGLPGIVRHADRFAALVSHSGPSDPQRYLFQWLDGRRRPSRDEIDSILAQRSITGRRFYAAIHLSERATRSLRDLRDRSLLDDRLVSVLFTRYRIEYASQRASPATDSTTVQSAYQPSPGRRRMMRLFSRVIEDPMAREARQLQRELRSSVEERLESLEPGALAAFRDRPNLTVVVEEGTVVPGLVSRVLARRGGAPDRRSLLEGCLRTSLEDDEVQRVRRLVEGLRSLDERGRQHHLEELSVGLREIQADRKTTRSWSHSGLSRKLGLNALASTVAWNIENPWPGLAGAAVSITPEIVSSYRRWRRKRHAVLLAEVLPFAGHSRRYLPVIEEIFGVPPE